MFNPVADAIGAILEPAKDQLFELLRGIKEEQVSTNRLLNELLERTPHRPVPTSPKARASADRSTSR